MKKRGIIMRGIVALLALAAMLTLGTIGVESASADGRGDTVVFVRSQGLYYDTIVLGELPPRGPFQILEMGDRGLETEWGPGDHGYVGGRWAEDFDGDGEFNYFLCPLLGPGRENP